jgi:dihydroflavonol-4-reductase
MARFNQLISDIAGVPLPKIKLPDNISLLTSYLLNFFAKFTSRPPLLGMSIDQVKTMKGGLIMTGTKAEKELGLKYTPIRKTLEEMITSLSKQ